MCVLATNGIGKRFFNTNNLGKLDTIIVVKSMEAVRRKRGLNKHGISTYNAGLVLCHTSRTPSDPLAEPENFHRERLSHLDCIGVVAGYNGSVSMHYYRCQ
jgi:hypothetical protein